jgi:hypothetical protein
MAAPEWLVKPHAAILIWPKRQANPVIVVIKSLEDLGLHRLNYRQSFAGQETTLYKGRRRRWCAPRWQATYFCKQRAFVANDSCCGCEEAAAFFEPLAINAAGSDRESARPGSIGRVAVSMAADDKRDSAGIQKLTGNAEGG